MYLCPIGVPGYMIPFITKEMDGISVVKENSVFTTIKVDPKSTLGMFLTRRIKPSYKVKFYNFSLYSSKIGNKRAFSAELLECQNSAQLRVDLTFEELYSFYKFLECHFRMSFFFYVKGFCAGSPSHKKIKEAISLFCDTYDLLEYGYSEKVLRNIYNKYQHKGSITKLHKYERLSNLSL